MSAREELAAALHAAVRAIPIRLGPNSLDMAQRGTPIVLTGSEADQFVGGVLAAVNERLADAWDEGYDAGDTDARAVQATYPDPTPNPYRQAGDG